MTSSSAAPHNAVMQHSIPKTAAEGGNPGVCAARPDETRTPIPQGRDQRLIMK